MYIILRKICRNKCIIERNVQVVKRFFGKDRFLPLSETYYTRNAVPGNGLGSEIGERTGSTVGKNGKRSETRGAAGRNDKEAK